jgi:hypothetical protein
MTTLRTRLTTVAAIAALATTGLALAAGPATASVPACGNSSLKVTNTPTEGATGHGSVILLFHNISSSACTIYGYPGLDALNSSGHTIAPATRTLHGFAGGPKSETTVTVQPTSFASAIVEWMNFNPKTSGSCTFSKSIATTPANTSHTVHLAVSVSVCSLQVHPTVAGSNGYADFAYAQARWLGGATVSAAVEGSWWAAAAGDLGLAGSEYATQISELKSLIALPNTDQTPAQNATFHHDVAALDSFFQTPALYS